MKCIKTNSLSGEGTSAEESLVVLLWWEDCEGSSNLVKGELGFFLTVWKVHSALKNLQILVVLETFLDSI